MSRMGAEDGFEKDVPEHLRSETMERISEAAWGHPVEGVTIIDSEKRNVTNVEATGTILINGVERWFHVRDGDMAGTELVGWENAGPADGIERHVPEKTTLVPLRGNVSDAISRGTAHAFLARWDLDLVATDERGAKLSKLPGSAAYDAFFSPNPAHARSHHAIAREHGYEIAGESEAVRMRRQLMGAILSFAPADNVTLRNGSDRVRLAEILRGWEEAADPDTEIGAAVKALMDEALDRMAAGSVSDRYPTVDETRRMKDLGYLFCDVRTERAVRYALVRPILSVEPIEGFDPETLPENPLAAMFKALDPSLVSSTRVNPEHEAGKMLDWLANGMAKQVKPEVPESYQESAERIGYRIIFGKDAAAEPEPEGMEP